MASCEGWAGVGVADGAGSDAASAAAIEVAILVAFCSCGNVLRGKYGSREE